MARPHFTLYLYYNWAAIGFARYLQVIERGLGEVGV
jgi:hypothetical protein